ncbi:nucleoside triphosphate pyrophosphohydrolase [Acidipila sp. EB88]|uniref:nucleoside triphosphate pyrophosphohydrolase n=1 Tax=Acidipila sp. EB88 TaxID=2305226 RepID=UPI000F5EC973|nr:nucleoside triphosphate pyrophosphohydrolase [Acidipila sp. EB88]RRA49407.1 nucleoside triphosphate pyrophosphohydrolase [Acidipila sp. EB88]
MAPPDVTQGSLCTAPETASSAASPVAEEPAALFAESVAIMRRLRGPDGCSWDREQTPETIRKYTLEETYEVLDAIERKDSANLCEELGDMLLQVLFYAQMASEAGEFGIADVLSGLNRKLVRRHPHVFGAAAAEAAGNAAVLESAAEGIAPTQVLANWNAIKRMERQQKQTPGADAGVESRMAAVLRAQPALLEAQKLGSAAAKVGFDWPDATGLLAKIREEADEVEAEIAMAPGDGTGDLSASSSSASSTREMQLEVGDLLFVVSNLARHLHVNAEMALRDANAKFRSRFASMEQAEREGGAPLEQRSLDELEALWQQAKQRERLLAGLPGVGA